jgi:hypothetical protein
MGGRCVRYGWIGGWKDRYKGPEIFFFYIYDVITWEKKKALLITTDLCVWQNGARGGTPLRA